MNKTVFLDRDGTINIEKNYLYRTEDFRFIDGAVQAIRSLNETGYLVIVVTNQAGVARGYYSEEDVKRLHEYMNQQLKEQNAHIDAFYYCPHHPVNGVGAYKIECKCRKPETGMLEAATLVYDIDKTKSYMIGDNKGDILAGRQFGVKTILVGTGYGKGVREELEGMYHYYEDTIGDAVRGILKLEEC